MIGRVGKQLRIGLHTLVRLVTRGAALCGVAALFLGWQPSLAQVPMPTPEQLQLLNSLPPAQRDQILGQLRQLQTQGQVGAEQLAFPEVVQPALEREISASEAELALGLPPRLGVGSTVIIEFTLLEDRIEALREAEMEAQRAAQSATQQQALPAVQPTLQPETMTEEERFELEAFRDRLAAGNPYELDVVGNLYLPGVPTMALAGLNVDEAATRIRAEPSLREFQIEVTLLPLEPVGVEALEPFGYDLFRGTPTTFAPATDVPVPAEYVMGPGDTVNVQLFGNVNADYPLIVSREGAINFPEIGPINVGGLTFVEMRETVTGRIAEQMIGVRASITLGELRSIRVFVLGDVERPGSYTVSGLSTMTNALFVSGGVLDIGSLRNIALRRDGETVATLDLYDLLLRGDTSGDERLLPGDVIFVPPIGDTISIEGSVLRPAIYERNGENTLDELIELAGGLRPSADGTAITVERIVPGRGVSVRDINLTTEIGRAEPLNDGDVIRVPANIELLEGAVRLVGNVYQPGLHEWYDGMTLVDLLDSPERLKPLSDLNYVLIRREIEPNVFVDTVSADLQEAWRAPNGPENIELRPRDTVYVFNIEIGREHIVLPLLDELAARSPVNRPIAVARVGGEVRAPGDYPLEPGMRVSDLIRAGGGFTESAYVLDAELARYEVINGEYRETELLTVDLAAILSGNTSADLMITAHDYLNIREVPLWREQQAVELIGEVQFPGVYPIRQGESLSSILTRAGGFTDYAFLDGGIFIREELREREAEQLETLANRVEADLATISVSDTGLTDAITVGQSLVAQLRSSEPVGRLVIDLRAIYADPEQDIVLKNGDTLMVPETTQSVTVLGEVQYATSHLFDAMLDRDDYILRSGGLTSRADRRRIYVVRASGEVVARGGSRWFSRSGRAEIRPGDTVVVPMDIDRGRQVALWSGITQIIYQLAIAAAAVNSF